MTGVDIAGEAGNTRLELHEGLTVVRVDVSRRREMAHVVAASIGATVVAAEDLSALASPATSPAEDDATAEAAVAAAEAAVGDARVALEQAERAYASAQEALGGAPPGPGENAAGAVREAEARLEAAQGEAAAARRALVQARETDGSDAPHSHQHDDDEKGRLEALRNEKQTLEERRAELLERLRELGAAPDATSVEEQLSALRRLRSVEPRPSERAIAIADRWTAVHDRLAALPLPPPPPEWLVTPALAALQDAREALARAESTMVAPPHAPQVTAVERAHRELLEAEQRVMRKGSRLNRRRLEQAGAAERKALDALGASSYGDYLQRIAPDAGGGTKERLAQARAALADAEAVWEELHGGAASPEYTAAKEEQAEIRAQALALLGEDVDDFDLERRLRSHVETPVDAGPALEQLADELRAHGVDPGDDPQLAAEAWLTEARERLDTRRRLDDELGASDARLKEIDEALTTQDIEAFFGSGGPRPDPLAKLTRALEEAEASEREAADALAVARARLEAGEQVVETARAEVDEARARLAEAETALTAARDASADAAAAATAAREARTAASSPLVGLAAEVWLLARLVAARASSESTAVVVDAQVALAPRALRLLERAAERGRVVVLGDEDVVTQWAEGLGDRAAIRTI